ncbi:hypothetical protein BVC80_1091g4 [Macleaya cordata]|uniref:Uncharacterized protein n=1 Tax=Macleaya cordata TaxID=56857 RepID=A0A200PZL4_MACCD|nr:hypothetical protein BVC80_1091g4 [Macleaya cordata]
MEAAFCLSHLPPILSLPPKSSHLNGLFTSNRTSLSYSSPTTTKQQYLSCTTNNKQHLSCFRHSFTGVPPRKYVFHPTPTCAFDDGRVPAAKKDKGNGDKKKQGIIVGSAARVVLACTLLGVVMCSNGRLIQAKAYNIPGFQNKQTTELPLRFDEEINMLKSEYKETCKEEGQERKMLESADKKTCKKKEKALQNEMLLAEGLICLGKYEEALSLNCLSSYEEPDDVITSVDIRIYLYKTFLYLMTEDKAQAKIWGKALIENFDKATTWDKAGAKLCLRMSGSGGVVKMKMMGDISRGGVYYLILVG